MTLAQMLRSTVAKHGSRTAFLTLGKDAITWSYDEMYGRVQRYAAALQELGIGRGDKLSIIAENSPEWALTDWACQCLGIVVTPIYPTLPADQTAYILKDSGAKLAVVGAKEQADKTASIEGLKVIYLKGADSLDARAAAAKPDPAKIEAEIEATDPEDPCTIIYTSGTTGTPKGAVMPNRAFFHVCQAAKGHIDLTENDSFLSFLPMSHVYERVAGQCLPVYLGASICYSKGLSALSTEMAAFKPTIFLVVPRFLENLRERILSNVAKEPPIRQKVFHMALNGGIKKARGGFAPFQPLLDKLAMSKVRDRTGGRLRYFVSGGAALAPVVAEFYMAAGLTVLQGYGLTETSGGTCVNKPENNKYWTVGEPLQMEAKIAEDGEILFRGPGIMLGYYNLPDETAKAIDSDGWFHTGDIGEFEGKNLKITDRKKDLLVLANGKNVAPQMIENRLKASDYIQEAVVLGDGMEYCIALIIPKFEAVRTALKLPEDAILSQNEEARSLVKKEIEKVNKTLANFELVKKHAILDEPFTVEGGELTPTLKVKRRIVQQKFSKQIDTLR